MNDFLSLLLDTAGEGVCVLSGAETGSALPRIRLKAISEKPNVNCDDNVYLLKCLYQAGVYSAAAKECEELTQRVLSALKGAGADVESVRSADEKGVSGRVIRFVINKEEF